ncbi:MAG: magnesium transporter [Pirellulaceae bacterium]
MTHETMDSSGYSAPWATVSELVQGERWDELREYWATLPDEEQARTIYRLSDADEVIVLEKLVALDAAEVFRLLPEAEAARIFELLPTPRAASILHELKSDERADLLGDIGVEKADEIISELPKEEADIARELCQYSDDVAGGLMVREAFVLAPEMKVTEVIQTVANLGEDLQTDVRYGYVCDASGRMVGVLPMRDLLLVKPQTLVSDLMSTSVETVLDQQPLQELRLFFENHPYLAAPVVDESGVFKGVLNRDAVQYEEMRHAEADYLKSQGIVGGEELRSMPLRLRATRRLSWLSVNILLNVGAASVVAAYQETLQSVIALAVFLPIISDMSGCSGNQAVAVSMRELSLGLLRSSDIFRVWFKEASVGVINGTVLGALVAVVAYFYGGNIYLGLVVGFALSINTLIAVSIGGTIPLVLKRFGFDPAVSSGPLLTTVTDMCGFFLVLGLASTVLEYIK